MPRSVPIGWAATLSRFSLQARGNGSPMTWRYRSASEMTRLRERYGLRPLVIHANYLVNLAGGNPEFHAKSIAAFRGEVERALALCAEFLVLHPGSFRGSSREEGLQRVALAIEQAVDGLDLERAIYASSSKTPPDRSFPLAATSNKLQSCCTC